MFLDQVAFLILLINAFIFFVDEKLSKLILSIFIFILNSSSNARIISITEKESIEINYNGFEAEEWLTEDGVMSVSETGGNKVSYFFGPVNPLTSFLSGNITNFTLSNEIENTSLTSQLFKVTIPTLVLWGKYDFVVPPSLGFDTYNNISSVKKDIVIFEKSGHSPMSNEWRAYSDAIISFIEAI